MKSSRIILINVIVLIVIVAIGFGGYYYFYQSTNYISTDDATISGQLVPVSAVVPGRLTTWNGAVGATFSAGQLIGQEDQGGDNGKILAPIDGTIIQNNAVVGQSVMPGQPLATMADLKKLYVTANIDETDIQNVVVGKDVDIWIDAFPGQTFQGHVAQIGLATNSTFSLLPQDNTSGNYTKVVQRIPVKITFDNNNYPAGTVPGMNVTVRIHR
jgi:multidrug resistance efflux pump